MKSNFTILIVDDTPKNLQVLGTTLKQENYKVEFAVNGKNALDWIAKKEFDLILLDVMMPEIDGYEACEKIRAGSHQPNVPIIFLTAKTDSESVVKGFELGAQDYITKPFNTAELLQRVKTQIELKNSKEKLEKLNQNLEKEVKKRTSELTIAYEKLEQANNELSEMDAVKSEFLNMISQQLRSPLNGILGALHLIKDQADSHEMVNLINVLNDSVKKLENFTFLALNITSLRTGKYKLKKELVKIIELIEFSLIELTEGIKEKKLNINLISEDQELFINGDYDLLLKAFTKIINLVIIKSTASSEIKIEHFKKDEKVLINIFFHGETISKELTKKENSLNDLIQLDKGIDLMFVKLIFENHNALIEFNNEPEKGSSIKLIFNEK